MKFSGLKRYSLCIGVTILCLSILFGLLIANAVLESPWGEHNGFFGRCEKVQPEKFLREYANALSNLSFVFAGIYLIASCFWDWRYGKYPNAGKYHHLGYSTITTFIWGGSLIVEGYGSFEYHASAGKSEDGGWWDIFGIFILVWAVFIACLNQLYNAFRLFFPNCLECVKPIFIDLIGLVLYFALLPVWLEWEENILIPFGGFEELYKVLIGIFGGIAGIVLMVTISCICKSVKGYYRTLLLAPAIWIMIAVLSWFPEELNEECVFAEDKVRNADDSVFQLHALWHSAIGLSLTTLYLYFRTLGNDVASKDILSFILLKIPENEDVDKTIEAADFENEGAGRTIEPISL